MQHLNVQTPDASESLPASPRDGAPETSYQLSQPIIRPERRAALVRLHQHVAKSWNLALVDFLPHGTGVEFEGLGFESFAEQSAASPEISGNTIFAIEGTDIGGFLLLSPELAHTFVETRLAMAPMPVDRDTQAPFTRLEAAIIREALNLMVDRLGAAYLAAEVGKIVATRHCDQLKDTMLFSPEDYLVVLRFRLGGGSSALRATVATGAGIVNLVRNFAVGDDAGRRSPRVARVLGSLPVEVDLVLGSWIVTLDELSALKPGDSILLPGGDDAWLEASGVELRRVQASLKGRRVEIVVS